MNAENIRTIVSAPAGESESGAGSNSSTGSFAEAKEKISQTARATAARIKSATGETASRVKTSARNLAQEKKQQAAERIGGYGSAMHDSAKSFEEQDPNIAWATHTVADRLQGVADYVRAADFDQLREDAEDVARRHPVAFFGGMLIGGIVIGNLLKARRPMRDDMEELDATEPPVDESDVGNASGSVDLPEFPTTPTSTGL